MSLTSYRAAPSRVTVLQAGIRRPDDNRQKNDDRQTKGLHARPGLLFGGPFIEKRRFGNVRFADLAATYSPAS